MFEELKKKNFEILTLHHAEAILCHDVPQAIDEIESILIDIELPVEELIRGGGGEGKLTQRIRNAFYKNQWNKHRFAIKKTVDGEEKSSISHEIDHVKKFNKAIVAVEIEWNNKDPFIFRDLDNFKQIHAN